MSSPNETRMAVVVPVRPLVFTLDEAADALRISRNQLNKLLDTAGANGGRGHLRPRLQRNRLPDQPIPTVNLGRRRVIRVVDLEAYLARQVMATPASEKARRGSG